MTHLQPNLRPDDTTRASRLILAFADGDRVALNMVLAETSIDPVGVNGLVFALAHLARELTDHVAPDGQGEQSLRQYLAAMALREEDQP